MEKEIKRTIQAEKIFHEFYCDECKELIGETMEGPDGCYEELGAYEWRYPTEPVFKPVWIVKQGHYCQKCRDKISGHIEDTLKELGFKRIKSKRG